MSVPAPRGRNQPRRRSPGNRWSEGLSRSFGTSCRDVVSVGRRFLRPQANGGIDPDSQAKRMCPRLRSVLGHELVLHGSRSNTSATDDAGTLNGRSAGEDELGRRRETPPVKSCAYLVVEIARDGVERVILAPAGDATPRVEEAPATGDLHMGDFEKSSVADHELARGVDQGLSSFHARALRCAIDSTHHAR